MSYLVFARKYRPENFKEVEGQEHVTQTLKNAIKNERVGHAYLFAGPRGVGKTSIARIFAKALNCQNLKEGEPCGACENCLEIKSGTNIAVREIDGASNNSVDNVRELVDSFRVMPPQNINYKVYIIDEVHMLSKQAFNALLKSLEEPPPKTIFILATTEVHKIIPTVISRCQRFDFRAMSEERLLAGLNNIVESEKIKVEPEVLRMITRLADGSMRDAQSLLERVVSYSNDKITLKSASVALGAVDRIFLEELVVAIIDKEYEQLFLYIDRLNNSGFDPAMFLKEFVIYFQELLRVSFGGVKALTNLGVSVDFAKKQLELAGKVSKVDLQELVRIAREGADSALRSNYPLMAFEALVIRMASRKPAKEIEDIISGLRKFSKTIKEDASMRSTASVKASVESAPILKKKVKSPKAEKKVAEKKEDKQAELKKEKPDIIINKDYIILKLEELKTPFILIEHLKRASISYDEKVLKIKADSFSTNYLKEADNIELLKQQAGRVFDEKVEVVFKEDNGSQKESSDFEVKDFGQYNKQIEDLMEIFPGSVIQKVKS